MVKCNIGMPYCKSSGWCSLSGNTLYFRQSTANVNQTFDHRRPRLRGAWAEVRTEAAFSEAGCA